MVNESDDVVLPRSNRDTDCLHIAEGMSITVGQKVHADSVVHRGTDGIERMSLSAMKRCTLEGREKTSPRGGIAVGDSEQLVVVPEFRQSRFHERQVALTCNFFDRHVGEPDDVDLQAASDPMQRVDDIRVRTAEFDAPRTRRVSWCSADPIRNSRPES